MSYSRPTVVMMQAPRRNQHRIGTTLVIVALFAGITLAVAFALIAI
ncbi:MAG TPA: hypothetical protein VF942_17655 [Acidimicrobiales bacterium]